VFGAALVLPGAAQPALETQLGLDLAAAGLVASALSLGLGVGVVAGGPLTDGFARRPLLVGSAALAAFAALAVPFAPSWAGALAGAAGIGLGAGVYETLLNAAVPERRPESAAARLSLLHACATVGAALGAPALGAVVAARGFTGAYGALGVAFAAVALLGLGVRFAPPPHARPAAGRAHAPLPLRALAPFALAAFAYVGLETALSVLAAPVAASHGHGAARGMRALSSFWLGLLAARLAFAWLRRPARPGQLRLAGAAGALALAAGAAAPGGTPELAFGAAGLALGVVFPLVVALAGAAAPERRATAVGLVVGAGSLGGFALPWLAGALGDRFGARAAVGALALAAVAVALAAGRPALGGRRRADGAQ
jgi:fucose permease